MATVFAEEIIELIFPYDNYFHATFTHIMVGAEQAPISDEGLVYWDIYASLILNDLTLGKRSIVPSDSYSHTP